MRTSDKGIDFIKGREGLYRTMRTSDKTSGDVAMLAANTDALPFSRKCGIIVRGNCKIPHPYGRDG